MVAAFARMVFTQLDEPSGRALLAAEDDVLAYLACPSAHWNKIWSANPLERLNGEIARRNDVVGIFPNREALLRLGTALLVEQHDEWPTMGKRYLPLSSMTRLLGGVPGTTLSELLKEGMAVWDHLKLEADLHQLTGHDLWLASSAGQCPRRAVPSPEAAGFHGQVLRRLGYGKAHAGGLRVLAMDMTTVFAAVMAPSLIVLGAGICRATWVWLCELMFIPRADSRMHRNRI